MKWAFWVSEDLYVMPKLTNRTQCRINALLVTNQKIRYLTYDGNLNFCWKFFSKSYTHFKRIFRCIELRVHSIVSHRVIQEN